MAPRTRRTATDPPRSEVTQRALGEVIHDERRASNLSVEEAARRAQISPSAWRKIEAGKVPKPREETLVNMALGLDTDPNRLLVPAGYPATSFRYPPKASDTPPAEKPSVTSSQLFLENEQLRLENEDLKLSLRTLIDEIRALHEDVRRLLDQA